VRQWFGSIVFTTLLFGSVAVWSFVCLLLRLFGYHVMTAGVRLWARAILSLLRWCCRLDHRVRGLENLPRENTVVLMKHSSTWETIAQLLLFPEQTWVMKRELIWAPILGWALFFLKPIPINRQGGRSAVEQVIEKGRQRLDEGLWVVIFPEGTRVPLGETKRFGLSGVLLAQAAKRPIVPVAHDAGRYWPRRGLLKRAGTIQVVIGQPIETAGRDPRQLTGEIQGWMQTEIDAMSAAGE
jgi:1-acyl-sn-glycerol-3-phosphate acyltransferase